MHENIDKLCNLRIQVKEHILPQTISEVVCTAGIKVLRTEVYIGKHAAVRSRDSHRLAAENETAGHLFVCFCFPGRPLRLAG